jgi:hypothetical protein
MAGLSAFRIGHSVGIGQQNLSQRQGKQGSELLPNIAALLICGIQLCRGDAFGQGLEDVSQSFAPNASPLGMGKNKRSQLPFSLWVHCFANAPYSNQQPVLDLDACPLRGYFYVTRPDRRARTAALVRSSTPSLLRMLRTWVFTVPTVMYDRSAISALLQPATISSRISSSRSVRG